MLENVDRRHTDLAFTQSFIIGDHVGDWEHNMIRFQNGVPQAVWYSQHSNGEAFTYGTVEKYTGGLRVSSARVLTASGVLFFCAAASIEIAFLDLV